MAFEVAADAAQQHAEDQVRRDADEGFLFLTSRSTSSGPPASAPEGLPCADQADDVVVIPSPGCHGLHDEFQVRLSQAHFHIHGAQVRSVTPHKDRRPLPACKVPDFFSSR